MVVTENGTSYEGKVLDTFERNFHDESDFYAIVWDDEEGRIKKVEYATTRAYTYGNYAHVDATEDVIEEASNWMVSWAYQKLKRDDDRLARTISNGKMVEIYKGRKNPGAIGRVFWMRTYRHYIKIGVALSDRKDERGWYVDVAWDYVRNAQVLYPEQLTLSDDELRTRAQRYKTYWYAPFSDEGTFSFV